MFSLTECEQKFELMHCGILFNMPFYLHIITAVLTLRCFIILSLHYIAVYDSSGVSHDLTNITLALRTLGTFDFEDHSLTKLLRHCADKFLGSDNEEVYLT